MNKLTVEQAADILNMDVQSLRVGIQQGAFPFGTAYKLVSDLPILSIRKNLKNIRG